MITESVRQLEKVKLVIQEAKDYGHRCCVYYEELSAEVVQKLKDGGYRVAGGLVMEDNFEWWIEW